MFAFIIFCIGVVVAAIILLIGYWFGCLLGSDQRSKMIIAYLFVSIFAAGEFIQILIEKGLL